MSSKLWSTSTCSSTASTRTSVSRGSTARRRSTWTITSTDATSDLFKGPVGPPQECVKGAPEMPVLTYKDINCNVCGTREPGKKDLLQCRECSFAQHLSCKHRDSYVLPNEVPKEPWYCHECRPTIRRSHKARKLENTKDGRVPATWFTDFKGKEWHASTFKAGDVVLLNMKTLEAASRNHSGEFRLSVDTRFMLKPLRRNWGKTWRSRFADWAAGERVYYGRGVECRGGWRSGRSLMLMYYACVERGWYVCCVYLCYSDGDSTPFAMEERVRCCYL